MTLPDRLAELADEAPRAAPEPDLWARGRRYGRRRLVGTVAIVAATLLVLGLVGVASHLRSQGSVQPAGPTSPAALPDRIANPSPWLDGTDDAGPLGQLAALLLADRGGWFGSRPGVVGVSATTGEYLFLDLPDAAEDQRVALAPDGRHVAYWYTGETRLAPHPDGGSLAGIAVYDTSTGAVVRHAVPTDHGLAADTLIWADDARVVLSYGEYAAAGGGIGVVGLRVWESGSGADPTELPDEWGSQVRASDHQGGLLLPIGRGARLVDLDAPERSVRLAIDGGYVGGATGVTATALSGTGSVAWPKGTATPSRLVVVPVAEGRPGERVTVPDSQGTQAVLGWLDERHVVAARRSSLVRVDVETGETERVLTFAGGTSWATTQLASDLLAEPAVERLRPPRPLGRWQLVSAIGFPVLFGLFALLVWRRRVRA